MNKEYIYIDGKAIIKDENGNQTPIEYYDNLDEVLVQENFIETIENKIDELKSKKEKIKIEKAQFIPFMTCFVLIMIIFVTPPFMCWITEGTEIVELMVNSIFGKVNQMQLIQLSIGLPYTMFSIYIDCYEYKKDKDKLKEKNAITSELEVLEKMIVVSKEKLEKLRKDKTKNNETNEFRVVKVNDKEKLESLRDCLSLFYDLGYNSEKYYEYYEQGRLEDKLKKYYDEDEIQVAKQYFEEKEPVLSKKKTNNQQ